MNEKLIFKWIAMFFLLLSVAVLLYQFFPLMNKDSTFNELLNSLKMPSVLLGIFVVLQAMSSTGLHSYMTDMFQQLNGVPIILLILSIVVLTIYIVNEKDIYFDVLKLCISGFIGASAQKYHNKLGEK